MSGEKHQDTGGLSPQYQTYERQKCFIAYTEETKWSDDLLSACREVLSRPGFNLEADYARKHFAPDVPLRHKALELIANARYGIYDLSYWQDEDGEWRMPCNVFIELGMAIALNRPTLLLRHTSNRDGLLHITDMSWGRVSHPSELVSLGDEMEVKVLNYDRDRDRISLGLKQLTPYPWDSIEEKYPIGERVQGKVVSITDYGAFVELEQGVEGLIHISEMSWTHHIRHPSKVVSIGDMVNVVVLKVNKEEEKISLSLKQTEPDPWETIDERYPVGTKIAGEVRNLTNFGAFVEVEEGIDGLVHISDMSWTKRIHHPSEIMKKGDIVEVVVLNIDKDRRRISLGYKQLTSDPWGELYQKYAQGTEVMGTIVRLLDRGVVVELYGEVEGFVPASQLAIPGIQKPEEAFQMGDSLPLTVIEFDEEQRRIVLSVREYFKGRYREELEAYRAQHTPEPTGVSLS